MKFVAKNADPFEFKCNRPPFKHVASILLFLIKSNPFLEHIFCNSSLVVEICLLKSKSFLTVMLDIAILESVNFFFIHKARF